MSETRTVSHIIAVCDRGHRVILTEDDDLCPVCDANGELTEIVKREVTR